VILFKNISMKLWEIINKSFGSYNIKGLYIEPTYWQAGAIIILIFFLLFTLARLRFLYVHWSLGHHALAMFFWGFLLALIIEGFLIIGGRTMLTEVIGWKNVPKPIGTALDAGRAKLVDVLGVTDEIPQSKAGQKPSYQSVVSDFQSLSPEDSDMVKSFICQP